MGLKPHCLYGVSNWLGLNIASPITSPSLPPSLFESPRVATNKPKYFKHCA